jgi:hypothetical protein
VGGGANLNNSSPTFENCLISNNFSQGDGGGIVCRAGSDAQFINVTITANFANDGGGGFACETSSPVFLNSILAGNDANAEPEFSIWDDYSDPRFNYCNTEMEWTGENNFYADPMFVDADNGDFHLSNLSSCIGAGTSSGAPEYDIEGNPRPDPPGSNPDLGAFENVLSEPWHATISVTPSSIDHSLSESKIDSLTLKIQNIGLADLEFVISSDFVTILDSQNYALSITDSMSYLEIANPDSFDMESEFSFSAWIKTDESGVIFSKSRGMDEPGPKTLFIANGILGEEGVVIFDIGFVGGLIGSRIVNDNVWHHIALTVENNGDYLARLYIDGELDAEDYIESDLHPTLGYNLRLGFDGREPHEFPDYKGYIDEVNFWDQALDKTDVQALLTNPPDINDLRLTAYWMFDEQSGSLCYDSTPHKNNGTMVGSVERSLSNVPYNPWMTCDPSSGLILAENEWDVTVTFDATGLAGPQYLANLILTSNDPANPRMAIPVQVTIEPTAIGADQLSGVPEVFGLSQNYPNPFNPVTRINYQLPMANDVELSIYNLLGQKVATLVDERKQAGYHQVDWDASGYASGVYYYHIKAGAFQEVKRMILIR